MENQTQSTTLKLIQQVKELGLLSEPCVTCSSCKAVFPNQYGECPRCNLEHPPTNLEIDFEI